MQILEMVRVVLDKFWQSRYLSTDQQHGPCNRPVCVNFSRTWSVQFSYGPCHFGRFLAVALLQHGSTTRSVQDPCKFDFAHTVRACQVTVRAIAFTHTFYAYMNLSHCWMNLTFRMIDSALGLFMKVVDNFLSFP